MPFNGSGSYSRLYSWIQDKANGIFIDSTRSDNELNGFATGLSNVICKDGQTTLTADIPWNGKKITGYGTTNAPSARSDVPQMGQVQDGTINWVVAGGTADAITAAYAPVITALVDGQECRVRAAATNATTTPTFSPNGLTAHTITLLGGKAVGIGEWISLQELTLRYNLANTRWELVNPALGLHLLQTQTVSAVATVSFTSGITSSYDEYLIVISNLQPATNNTGLYAQISQDAGANWKSGASDYRWTIWGLTDAAGAMGVAGSGADVGVKLMSNASTTSGRVIAGEVRIFNASSATVFKSVRAQLTFWNSSANYGGFDAAGAYVADGLAINGVRFLFDAGNIATGTFSLYGLRK